jgi:predicted ATPase
MITKIKILEGFENAENSRGGKVKGYHLDAFQVGQELDTDSNLVILIGDNGSGKSTFLRKLHAQEMASFWSNHLESPPEELGNPYFELTHRGGENQPPILYNEEKQPEDSFFDESLRHMYGGKPSPEKDRLKKYSSGQYSIDQLDDFLRGSKKASLRIRIFDQPEDGISIFRRQALVDTFAKYAFGNNVQIFVATHEPRFLYAEGAKIINLEDKPAQVYDGGKFDITPYMKSMKSLKEGLF